MKTWLIADSGGTSTSWAFGKDYEIGRFVTSSLHPRNLEYFPSSEMLQLIELNSKYQFNEVLFYGAGMSNIENQNALRTFLKEVGFSNLQIGTDALCAGLACCGLNHGFTAILGTGSILLEMNGGEIVHRIGGLGPEIGDEGSAFYFGKLVREYLLKADQWTLEWIELFGSKEQFTERYSMQTDPTELAALSGKLASKDFKTLHSMNIDLFIDKHLNHIVTNDKEINIVGSYGYYQVEIIRERLKSVGWRLNKSIKDPMDELVKHYLKNYQQK